MYTPSGSSSSRTRRSSSAVGGGVAASVLGDLDVPADGLADGLDRGAGMDRREPHLAGLVERVRPEVGDDERRAAPSQPPSRRMRSASAAPPRLPGDVRKSIDSTNERFDWRMITNTWRALIAISQAPPLPGSRVVGLSYGPMTVVLMLPNRSIWAAPRNPTSIRPPCR